ncbi:hypothetical protein ACFPYI_03885 [Halomarina salina]|uniref:Halobacterial output domain-containing protein n=1 Tax=Halomarina salina TaxID=1872699 RepID=A0ABD5RIS9_9EURY|nr:hypothetical protein [Halomarina salina]
MSRARALDVTADLTLTIDGEPIAIESYTDTVLVDFPSVRALAAVARTERQRLPSLERTLRRMDLTVVVLVDGVAVGTVGARAKPQSNRLPLEVDAGGTLRAAVAAPLRFFN